MDSITPEQFDTPILFLIFNRPDLTARVFERIREVKPKFLFVAADGPRKDKPEDIERCEAARQEVLDRIDWPCELNTLFRDVNLGCGVAVSEAITWFFDHVEMGIILEDDCLPDISFFTFCSDLLLKYKDEIKIMHIGGSSFLDNKIKINSTYYFSNYPHIWGWATWKNAWNSFKLRSELSMKEINETLKAIHFGYMQKRYWSKEFYNAFTINKINTWDYSWQYTIYKEGGVSVLPKNTIIKNIGFGVNATHTLNSLVDYIRNPVLRISTINHPNTKLINKKADRYNFNNYFYKKTTTLNNFRNLAYAIIPARIYYYLKVQYQKVKF